MMLGAISAAHHGWPIFPAHGDSEVGVLTLSSSYVQFGMKSDKKVSNESPMGLILYLSCQMRKNLPTRYFFVGKNKYYLKLRVMHYLFSLCEQLTK
jgi:hypothetical protein